MKGKFRLNLAERIRTEESIEYPQTSPRYNYMSSSRLTTEGNTDSKQTNYLGTEETGSQGSPSVTTRYLQFFTKTPKEKVIPHVKANGFISVEKYLLVTAELERLTAINKALVQENQELSSIRASVSAHKLEKLLEVNEKLNEEVNILRREAENQRRSGSGGFKQKPKSPGHMLCIEEYSNSNSPRSKASFLEATQIPNNFANFQSSIVSNQSNGSLSFKDREVQQLKEQCSTLELQKNELETKRKALEIEHKELEGNLKKLQYKYRELEDENQELALSNSHMKNELAEKEERIRSIQAELSRARETNANITAEFKAKMNLLESKVLTLAQIYEGREKESHKKIHALEENQQQLLENIEKTRQLNDKELFETRKKLQRIEDQKSRIRKLEVNIQEFIFFLNRKNREIDELHIKFEEAKEIISQLTNEKEDLGDMVARIDRLYAGVNSQSQQHENRIEELIASNNRFKRLLELKDDEIRELISKYQLELELKQEEIERLLSENSNTKVKYILVCMELERMLTAVSELQGRLSREMKDVMMETDPRIGMKDVEIETDMCFFGMKSTFAETELPGGVDIDSPHIPRISFFEEAKTEIIDDLSPTRGEDFSPVRAGTMESVKAEDFSSEFDSDESDDEIDDIQFSKTHNYRRGGLLDGAKDPKRRDSILMQIKRFQVIAQEVEDLFKKYDIKRLSMVLGIDCTASNTWSGKRSFGGKSLHHIHRDDLNFYEQAFGILGSVVERFDAAKSIPAYFFGDRESGKESVTPLFHDPQTGSDALPSLDMVLRMYRRKIKITKLGGHTSFVPLIQQAIKIVEKTKVFHLLVIIGDGGCTDIKANCEAVRQASEYPIGIMFIGVGDGDYKDNPKDPWYRMKQMSDELPNRKFDNFNFVLVKPGTPPEEFAKKALAKVPQQYIYCKHNGMINE